MRTPEDWQEAALDVIASAGVGAVSIPRLATDLGVTKGSFYWHFTSLDQLIAKSVERWEAADDAALDSLRRIADPAARLRAMFSEAMSAERAQHLYLALMLSPSPDIGAALRRVAARRIRLLSDSYRELGMSDQDARRRALLTYSAYIGTLYLRKSTPASLRSSSDVAGYVDHAARALISSKK